MLALRKNFERMLAMPEDKKITNETGPERYPTIKYIIENTNNIGEKKLKEIKDFVNEILEGFDREMAEEIKNKLTTKYERKGIVQNYFKNILLETYTNNYYTKLDYSNMQKRINIDFKNGDKEDHTNHLIYWHCIETYLTHNNKKNVDKISLKEFADAMEEVDTFFSEIQNKPIDLKERITWSQALNPIHINFRTHSDKVSFMMTLNFFFLQQIILNMMEYFNPAEATKMNIISSIILSSL